jgi:hypothetical protein
MTWNHEDKVKKIFFEKKMKTFFEVTSNIFRGMKKKNSFDEVLKRGNDFESQLTLGYVYMRDFVVRFSTFI